MRERQFGNRRYDMWCMCLGSWLMDGDTMDQSPCRSASGTEEMDEHHV